MDAIMGGKSYSFFMNVVAAHILLLVVYKASSAYVLEMTGGISSS